MLKVFLVLLTFLPSYALADMTEWADFQVIDGLLVFDIELYGKPAKALIDSGSQINMISVKAVEENRTEVQRGKKITTSGVIGSEKSDIYKNVPVTLFGIKTKLVKVSTIEKEYADIFLGLPFLRSFIIQIDYPNSKIRLLTKESIDLELYENIAMKTHQGTNFPLVEVSLNDENNVWLVLDLAYTGSIFLDRAIAKRKGWLKKFSLSKTELHGAIEQLESESFWLPEIQFGPIELENIKVTIPPEGENIHLFEIDTSLTHINGVLGYEVLKHFVLTIDFKIGKMHIGYSNRVGKN